MYEHNDSTQELSAAQEHDQGCPECGGPIRAVTRRGPGEVRVDPCGHEVGDTLARYFQRGRLLADGGTSTCEVPNVDEHRGSVFVVEDEEGNILAMCWECRRNFSYNRVLDENPGAARADGGEETPDQCYVCGYEAAEIERVEHPDVSDPVPVCVECQEDLRTDGGAPASVEDSAAAAHDLLARTDVPGDFDVTVRHTTGGAFVSITPPAGVGLSDSLLSRLESECGLTIRAVKSSESGQFTVKFHPITEPRSEVADSEEVDA